MEAADFSGYATKAGIVCSDGRTITPEAFKHQDTMTVPLVWQHGHDDPKNILGYAVLEARGDGIYTKGYFNHSEPGQHVKGLVEHGDVKALSIYANQLVEKSKQVLHGMIREVSIVLAGANKGAFIDFIAVQHSDGTLENLEDSAVISMGLELEFAHSTEEAVVHADGEDKGRSAQEVYDTLDDDQKDLLAVMVEEALKANPAEAAPAAEAAHSDEGAPAEENTEGNLNNQEGTEEMVHTNLFEGAAAEEAVLQHGGTVTGLSRDQIATLLKDGQQMGSLKESVLAHAEDYGITNIEVLFPDAKTINNTPQWITRRMEWVEGVLNGTRKLPFSKIKTMTADLTHDEARAKGYVKGTLKKEQFFEIAFRETGPKTIYKKQKLDRDDITDLTEFDVVAWLWVEMRFMLREEIARAILIGDGREVDDEDKIDENKIRPIATDDEFYTDVIPVPANVDPGSLVEAVIRGRERYKGSGDPTAYMFRSVYNDMVLQKDKMGRRLYRTRAELAAELEVDNIVLVPVMEGAMTDDGDLLMILVNLSDYAVGSTRGGEISQFDDFDIDYNQYKYLIEGRMSGALVNPKSAQVVVRAAGTSVTPSVPTFVSGTGVVTIPSQTGVVYKNQDTDATLSSGAQSALASGATLSVEAQPATGYYFPHNIDADWDFTRP